jgi:hypothetical protein
MNTEYTTFKLILAAEFIPLESKVTKKTGQKPYTLRDKLRIFNENHTQQEVKATDGARFLVSENGDANVVSGSTELLWHIDARSLRDYIDGFIEGSDQ